MFHSNNRSFTSSNNATMYSPIRLTASKSPETISQNTKQTKQKNLSKSSPLKEGNRSKTPIRTPSPFLLKQDPSLNRKTLVLDLDETLVHSILYPIKKSHIVLNVLFCKIIGTFKYK